MWWTKQFKSSVESATFWWDLVVLQHVGWTLREVLYVVITSFRWEC